MESEMGHTRRLHFLVSFVVRFAQVTDYGHQNVKGSGLFCFWAWSLVMKAQPKMEWAWDSADQIQPHNVLAVQLLLDSVYLQNGLNNPVSERFLRMKWEDNCACFQKPNSLKYVMGVPGILKSSSQQGSIDGEPSTWATQSHLHSELLLLKWTCQAHLGGVPGEPCETLWFFCWKMLRCCLLHYTALS